MFEQDYIMRLIKELVRLLVKLIFGIDRESPTEELLENAEERQTLDELLEMIDAGDINKAENRLYEMISPDDKQGMKLALLFYSYLNEKSDDYLEAHDYTRAEIRQGLEDMAARYGLGGMVEAFLADADVR